MLYFVELVVSVKVVISQVLDVVVLDNVCVEYLGKKGYLIFQMMILCELLLEECLVVGVVINEVKEQVQQVLNVCKVELESVVLNVCLVVEMIDVFLLGCCIENGGLYLVICIIDCIESFFGEFGFIVVIGLEIEDDYYNFDVLNIFGYYLVCVDYDIFWFDIICLLCIQIFGVQICIMKVQQLLICIIVFGCVYCNDYDQIYMLMFYQMEGLIVDINISFINLKGMLYDFLCNFFEEDLQICFCFFYFLFIEFFVEVDVMGKNGKWLEVLGCGMVYLNVLCNVGIDLEVYFGFVFGMGMECLIMLCYGVIDLCLFFENDLCFFKQFK